MIKGPPIFSIDVVNFAIVTYLVPAERIYKHLPSSYELDLFDAPDAHGFVSTTCFCNRDFRQRADEQTAAHVQ